MNPYAATLFIFLLDYRAYTHNSLTPLGIVTATVTAIAHAVHPWNIFFTLLGVFFLTGTTVTKVKADVKAGLTVSASSLLGSRGEGASHGAEQELGSTSATNGETTTKRRLRSSTRSESPVNEDTASEHTTKGTTRDEPKQKNKPQAHPRTSIQVLCNSLPATLCILLHAYTLHTTSADYSTSTCLPHPASLHLSQPSFTTTTTLNHNLAQLLPYAILSHYASATADTFSSELGILSSSQPILLTSLFTPPFRPKYVPRGTNGALTLLGTLSGLAGAAVIGVVAVVGVPFCEAQWDGAQEWTWKSKLLLGVGIAVLGLVGSLLDSVLGALVQGSVVVTEDRDGGDVGTGGRVVEDEGGGKVRVGVGIGDGNGKGNGASERRFVMTGRDWLSNNGVNLAMCSIMCLVGMGGAWTVGWALG